MMLRLYPPLMAPASLTIGLMVALCLLPGLARARPMLPGSYRADPYGALTLTTDGDRVSGLALEGGACRFQPARRVLGGEFQGSVLVGWLTVCQTGEKCSEQEHTYPILAFYSATDGSLTAYVRLQEGCQSPALKGARFILQPLRAQEPAGDITDTHNARGADEAKQALELGRQLYLQQDYPGALKQFGISLSHDPESWAAYLGLGTSQLALGRLDEAIINLEHSRRLHARYPDTFYNLAYAYGRKGDKDRAMHHLQAAVKLGYALHEAVVRDPELVRDLGGERGFQALVQKARDQQKQSQPRERRESEP